jgi:hypothetical protein
MKIRAICLIAALVVSLAACSDGPTEPPLGGAIAGSGVYVFNLFPESARVEVNSLGAGAIERWGWESPIYRPAPGLKVPRSRYPQADNAVFHNGDNVVVVRWDSFTARATVPVSQDVSLTDDLLLYVTTNQFFLMNTRGQVIGEFKPDVTQNPRPTYLNVWAFSSSS